VTHTINGESVGQTFLVDGADESEVLREYLVPLLHLFLVPVRLPEPPNEPRKQHRSPALTYHLNHLPLHVRHHPNRIRILQPRSTRHGAQ